MIVMVIATIVTHASTSAQRVLLKMCPARSLLFGLGIQFMRQWQCDMTSCKRIVMPRQSRPWTTRLACSQRWKAPSIWCCQARICSKCGSGQTRDSLPGHAREASWSRLKTWSCVWMCLHMSPLAWSQNWLTFKPFASAHVTPFKITKLIDLWALLHAVGTCADKDLRHKPLCSCMQIQCSHGTAAEPQLAILLYARFV